MLPPDQDLRLSIIYRAFERSDGAVEGDWAAMAEDCSAAELEGLVERQKLLRAGRVQPVENTPVKITRHAATFSEAETLSLEKWLSQAITPHFASGMVASARETGRLVVANPLTEGSVWCDISICGGSVIFLRFQGGAEPFYLIQHNFAVEALFFPLREAMVHLEDCLVPKVKLARLFLQIMRGARQSVAYFSAAERRWAGLLVANESPYHFFYFQVPGVAISCLNAGGRPPGFHTLPAEHFLDVATMLGLGDPTRVHETPAALQSALVEERSFVFSVGLRPAMELYPQRLKMIDGALLAGCRRVCATDIAYIARNYDLVLWVGISSGKRAWHEEIEAIAGWVNRVATGFPRVLLLLDGWTATLGGCAGPAQYAGDSEAVARARSAVAPNVDCASLVGADPVRKIGLGSAVDFFICSHGTASLYVARICGRPGVSHISNAARVAASTQHIHPSTWLVPQEMVTDLPRTDARNKFTVDYRIDPDAFVAFAERAFLATRPRSQSKLVSEIF